jgi:hypothetical protein
MGLGEHSTYVGAVGSWELDMAIIKFDSIEKVNNVMLQLPPETRAPDSGFAAKELEDGTYELTVPNQWAGAVRGADPDRAPPAPPRTVPKSLVMDRLAQAGKADGAFAALMGDPVFFTRWFSPDRPTVDSNDQGTIAFLAALGVDPDAILATP